MSTTRRLSGTAALLAAERTWLRKKPGELDTEFVKRIVNAYLDAEEQIDSAAYLERVKREYAMADAKPPAQGIYSDHIHGMQWGRATGMTKA